MVIETSDEILILACRRGDAKAWITLFTRYQRLIYTIARRAGLDKDQSEDILQYVFATLLEKLDTITQPERIRAWLVTTARREAWRLRQRERVAVLSLSDDGHTEALLDVLPIPDNVLMRLEEQHLVRLAVEMLDPRCQKMLNLLYYRPDPLSYAEVAAELGMSEGSIGPVRARCLQKLRRILQELGF